MRWDLFLLVAGAVAGSPVAVQGSGAGGPGTDRPSSRCRLAAFSGDTDRKGTNVRAAPRANAAIVGMLPPPRAQAGTRISAEFKVIGAKNGWFLIRDAIWPAYGEVDKDLPLKLKGGQGWIAANLARFEIESPTLRDAPRADAGSKTRFTDTLSFSRDGETRLERVYGCSGNFVDVGVRTPTGPVRGWAHGVCANQVTTCGGGQRIIEDRAGKLVDSSGEPVD